MKLNDKNIVLLIVLLISGAMLVYLTIISYNVEMILSSTVPIQMLPLIIISVVMIILSILLFFIK
ncbi:MAG: hypothetical protein RRA45_07625 [Saccharolobus sp.]|jgi:hypothetical protein|uniref:hypothetical protein n=1 Tax=Saccharolobus sp. TaxID=2100761 RepID=UPI0028CC9592|nr:hypothetical protein [Saccharolobus sp.]MDT7862066.1 hypothetical protein [Saccharolobus sp.]